MTKGSKPKPISNLRVGVRSQYNPPLDGYVTPRLNRREGAYAVGFTASITTPDEEEA
jgi:hypothetical protein